MAGLLDIGEVAVRSGMPASTLRYYEQQGIIASHDRKGLRRQYRPEVLDTLAMVALCQGAGFNLAEIKALLATGGDVEWKVLAARKRDELRDRARHLVLLADQIDHALGCRKANASTASTSKRLSVKPSRWRSLLQRQQRSLVRPDAIARRIRRRKDSPNGRANQRSGLSPFASFATQQAGQN